MIEFVLVSYSTVDSNGNKYSKEVALSIAEQCKGQTIDKLKIIDTKLSSDSNDSQGKIVAVADGELPKGWSMIDFRRSEEDQTSWPTDRYGS